MKERLGENVIAMRIARELKDGEVVNLGVGLPTTVSSYVDPEKDIIFHSEIGLLDHGRVLTADDAELMDYNLVNAGGQFVAPKAGMCFIDIADAFRYARTGRVDTAVFGAFQVSEKGDLANWASEPTGRWSTIGGAMDIPIGVKRLIIGMHHTDNQGNPKIVKKCTLPLTAAGCVDLIVTDLAVIEVNRDGLLLKEIAPEWTIEEIQALTEPRLIVSEVKEYEL